MPWHDVRLNASSRSAFREDAEQGVAVVERAKEARFARIGFIRSQLNARTLCRRPAGLCVETTCLAADRRCGAPKTDDSSPLSEERSSALNAETLASGLASGVAPADVASGVSFVDSDVLNSFGGAHDEEVQTFLNPHYDNAAG